MWNLYASLNNHITKPRTLSYLAALSYCFLAILWGGGGVNLSLATTPAAASNNAHHLTISPSSTQSEKPSATEETQPEILTAARVVLGSQRTLQNESAEIVVLTLQANNIQVAAEWSVTNAANNFAIPGGTLSLVDINKLGTLRATVYLADKFSQLNTAYTDLTVAAIITVSVGAQSADDYKAVLKAHFDSLIPYGTYTETATGLDVLGTLFGTSIKRAEVTVSNSGYTIGDYATTYPSEVLSQIDLDINDESDVRKFVQTAIDDYKSNHGSNVRIVGDGEDVDFATDAEIQYIIAVGSDLKGRIYVATNLLYLRSANLVGGPIEKFQTFKEALGYIL